MKLRCINESGVEGLLHLGGVYEVAGSKKDYKSRKNESVDEQYLLTNDIGREGVYYKYRFEIIDE